jgi:hypothetical protein
MKMRSMQSFVLFIAFLAGHLLAHAAAPMTKVIMTSGSASERDGAVYVARPGFLPQARR